jgi:hypothetical protein
MSGLMNKSELKEILNVVANSWKIHVSPTFKKLLTNSSKTIRRKKTTRHQKNK